MPLPMPATVAFLNENTLGHTSYLPRFVRELERRPEFGVVPRLLDVTPLPEALRRRADFSLRGLRKVGLDFHIARWRRVVSAHARNLLDDLRRREAVDAVVVNTQSVALDLADLAAELPVFVCLDATFAQLARTPWFRMNRVAGWLQPLTLASLLRRERDILSRARRLLAWSAPVRASLETEYGIPARRLDVLPPSLDLDSFPRPDPDRPLSRPRPRLLFLGGDFRRKGGPALLEAFRGDLARRADLHVITQSDIPPEPGVHVHRGITAGSPAWREHWENADLFVFPSRLETFGIVLVEAMAFGVPVIASDTGAAADLTSRGQHGVLLADTSPDTLRRAITDVLDQSGIARARTVPARARVERDFDLARNTERLARILRES